MRSLARAAASATRRLSTSSSAFAEAAAGSGAATPAAADAGAASRAAFQEKLRPFLSSTSAPPCFPSDFMKPRPAPEAGAGVPEKLTLNFFLPHEQPKKGAAVR
jgi:F-type H+-transporting ATPase subunit delta